MKNGRPPLLVAIAGGSGAGKTWLADKLQAALGGKATRLSLDNFYHDRSHVAPERRARINFDHPRAIDWTELEQVLHNLLNGRSARMPRYDFKTHSRIGHGTAVQPNRIILLDGLWLLRRPGLRRLFDLRIFVACPTPLRLRRRLNRDLRSRGRTSDSVRRQFRETVEPMHVRFVAPQERHADVVLKNGFGKRDVAELAERLKTMLGARAS
jgi:uridine kinase